MKISQSKRITFVKEKIRTDNRWLFRAIIVIYSKQTADEQATDCTRHENGVGFSGCDAEILSSFARHILRWNNGERKYPSPLSAKQIALARKKMPKYAGQIIESSDSEALDKMVEAAQPNELALDFGKDG